MASRPTSAVEKMNRFHEKLFSDIEEDLEPNLIEEKHVKAMNYMKRLVKAEAGRIGLTCKVSIQNFSVDFHLDKVDGIKSALKRRIKPNTLLASIFESSYEASGATATYASSAYDFIYLADLIPDDFGDERFAILALVEIMARHAGNEVGEVADTIYRSSLGLEEGRNLVEIIESEDGLDGTEHIFSEAMEEWYGLFQPNAFTLELERLNISTPTPTWDDEARVLSFWENEATEVEFEGLIICPHCGSAQVHIPDSLAHNIAYSFRSVPQFLFRLCLVVAQRGFDEMYGERLNEEEIEDSTSPVETESFDNMEKERFWFFLRGVIDDTKSRVERRSDGSTGGVALNIHNDAVAQYLIPELREHGIRVSGENILQGKTKKYLYVPAKYTKLICDKTYRELEEEILLDDAGEPYLSTDNTPLRYKDAGNVEKKELLYAAV